MAQINLSVIDQFFSAQLSIHFRNVGVETPAALANSDFNIATYFISFVIIR